MKSELREAIRRIHSADYYKILSTEKQLRSAKRRELLRRLPGWETVTRTPALRLAIVIHASAFVVLCVWGGIHYYNAFVTTASELERTSSVIDSEIKRRVNLIPNLTVVSAQYSAHEVTLYRYVSQMRTLLGGQKGKSPAETTSALEKLTASLLAVSEQYPDLKASRSFEQLMKDWTETENRIATARTAYIQAIRDYNMLWTGFPSNVYGFLFRLKRHTPYLYDESAAPVLDIKQFYSTYLPGRLDGMAEASPLARMLAQGRPTSVTVSAASGAAAASAAIGKPAGGASGAPGRN